MGRLVILAGPSCVGKGPLCAALERRYPELASALHEIVLYNSRAPRPGENDGVDYHFRGRRRIRRLKGRGFALFEVRGDLQAVDLGEVRERLRGPGDLFFEGNPFVAEALRRACARSKPVSVFLSPLSRAEILELRRGRVRLPELVADVMRRKLLKRTLRQKGVLSAADRSEIERRCRSAFRELGFARRFQFVLPNLDGEDSENWDRPGPPRGGARRVLAAFAAILKGRRPALAEAWERGLLQRRF